MPLFRIADTHYVELLNVRSIISLKTNYDGDKRSIKAFAAGVKEAATVTTFDMSNPEQKEQHDDVFKRLKELSL